MRSNISRSVAAALFTLALGASAIPAAFAADEAEAPATPVVPAFVFPINGAKVVDRIAQGISIYIAAQTPGGETVWIAAPVCEVKQGDTVSVPAGKFFPEVFNSALGVTFRNFVIPTKLQLNGAEQPVFTAHGLPQFCTFR